MPEIWATDFVNLRSGSEDGWGLKPVVDFEVSLSSKVLIAFCENIAVEGEGSLIPGSIFFSPDVNRSTYSATLIATLGVAFKCTAFEN